MDWPKYKCSHVFDWPNLNLGDSIQELRVEKVNSEIKRLFSGKRFPYKRRLDNCRSVAYYGQGINQYESSFKQLVSYQYM